MPRLTQKSQVTIPKSVRQILDVSPGDEVEFQVTSENQIILTRSVKSSAFSKYVGLLAHKSDQSSDQIVDALRGKTE
ncbi:MAG: AbrB/MazE/SpoVT family DNA-binding domain-containing protein [Candidatus Latescibacteria bacterium]|jgi:AbrB family looped-hinge helix DNA binding protein|nr:AbrB/MazE/SpoVT family DNA-binding domain-containing protein [Candidatus Latescibacterota bacterium]MBT4138782.1 AbrB/MazE/SpoVT family DNA-binding domain-containing protein [Candidatus Latescibacterota bacterium]MBT5831259.1 AbrB/MazE/SpoVT family DNA-binding domain-containing protein [Candidatus Latescibacterota bacterium]